MKTITIPIAASLIAAAASVMLASCKLDSIDVHDTGSGKMASGAAHEEPCKIVPGSTTIDTVVVECDVGDGFGTIPATFTGPAGLLTGAIVNLMYDPLIVELPASAGTPTGFFTAGPFGLSSSLHITAGLTSIPIDAKTTLVAEPGKQLMIVDVPVDFTATTSMSATFSLHYIDLTHSPIKVIFAAKVPVGATTYYPPLLPCVADFASVPEVPPGALTLAQVGTLLAGMTPCDHKAYDFGVAPPPPAAANYQGIWWNAPANSESGWGINLAHQGDKIFASWFTYDTMGRGWWLVMTADKTGPDTYTGKLYTTRGPAFNAHPWDPATVVATEAGTGTLKFTDANNGSFKYDVGAVSQTKTITREAFDTLPTCAYGTQPNLKLATNYQDLWWETPAGSESGWGINLNHEGNTIFATWFTYDLDGSPLWLVVTAPKTGPGTFVGDLYRTSGTRFDAFNGANVVPVKVGTATFIFADGNNASFTYTVQLAGMPSPVTQAKAIIRELFSPSGTTCQ